MVARQRREPQRQLGEIDRAAGSCRRRRGSAARRGGGRAAPRPRPAEWPASSPDGAPRPRPAASPSARQASTRKAPEPMAGSQTLRSRICSGVASGPSRSKAGSSAWRTIGSVSDARRVVAAGAAALVGRLQDRRAGGDRVLRRASRARRRSASSAAASSATRLRRLDRLGRRSPTAGRGRPPPSGYLMRSLPFAASSSSRSTKTGVRLFLPALMASARPAARLDREAHHGLVDRADLLDVERAVGQALARRRPCTCERHQPFEDAQDAAVGDRQHARRIGSARRGLRGTGTDPGSNSLPPRAWTKPARMALVDQAEQREQLAPAAAPLVHGVGIERGVLGEPGVEAAHANSSVS